MCRCFYWFICLFYWEEGLRAGFLDFELTSCHVHLQSLSCPPSGPVMSNFRTCHVHLSYPPSKPVMSTYHVHLQNLPCPLSDPVMSTFRTCRVHFQTLSCRPSEPVVSTLRACHVPLQNRPETWLADWHRRRLWCNYSFKCQSWYFMSLTDMLCVGFDERYCCVFRVAVWCFPV